VGSVGLTPTRVNTLPFAQGDLFPYFTIYGRSVSDDNGDVWVVIYKAKVTDGMNGSFQWGEFRTSGISFMAVPDSNSSNKLLDIVQHETTVALPTT
jgi:hypothetical protein